jgi:hypothetical protein
LLASWGENLPVLESTAAHCSACMCMMLCCHLRNRDD